MSRLTRLLPIGVLAIATVTPAPTAALTFAQLACESRCMTNFRTCLTGGGIRDVDSGGYAGCERQAVDCKFGCTGALDPIAISGIDPTATLRSRGHRLLATGHLACEAGAAYALLLVTATQGDAVAASRTTVAGTCNAESQAWDVTLVTTGPDAFVAGEGEICAIADVFDDEGAFETRHWCVTAMLGE